VEIAYPVGIHKTDSKMIHVTSHGTYGESVLITAPTAGEAEFEIMEYQADNPHAKFGPIVSRHGCFGACGKAMAEDI
jgi:hypothetical protein